MANKKELRKLTQTEKVILQTRGEAVVTLGVITIALSMLMAIVELANNNGKRAFGFILFSFAYLAGAALFSYKYQRSKGFLILGIVGILLTIGCFIIYIL